MAAVSSSLRVAGLGLVAALTALPLGAQQTLDQPVYVPPATSRIETAPLPPIGGDPEGAGGDALGEDAPGEAGDGMLPRPRFLRAPSAGDGRDRAGGGAGTADGWDRSSDGRFHRAPESDDAAGSTETAPAPVVPIDPPATDLRAGARLRELDKMTGQTKTFEIGVGETREVDRLRIRLEACRSPEGNDMHGTMAFLKVWDTKYSEAEAAFSGWMFAESPALSALDHPRYDLWVISCTTSALATSASRQ